MYKRSLPTNAKTDFILDARLAWVMQEDSSYKAMVSVAFVNT